MSSVTSRENHGKRSPHPERLRMRRYVGEPQGGVRVGGRVRVRVGVLLDFGVWQGGVRGRVWELGFGSRRVVIHGLTRSRDDLSGHEVLGLVRLPLSALQPGEHVLFHPLIRHCREQAQGSVKNKHRPIYPSICLSIHHTHARTHTR